MQTTEILGLRKPEENDFYDVNDFNNNADALDALFEKDENGSVAAKNAKQLDGHEADYFAIKGEPLEKTPLLEKALTLSNGTHEFVLEGGYYTGGDLPNVNYSYGTATVKVRSSKDIVVILWGRTGSYYPQINFYNGTEWSGWIGLFTTAGGTIDGYLVVNDGDVRIITDEAVQRYLRLKNANRRLDLIVNAGGSAQLRDETNSKNIIESKLDGTNTFNGHSSEDLPLNGGMLQSTSREMLKLKNLSSADSAGGIGFYNKDGTKLGEINVGIYGLNFINSETGGGRILHTGNKPTGTYTGNGSATERQISTGGIGSAMLVVGGGHSMIVLPNGAFGVSKTGTAVNLINEENGIYFVNGICYMATASDFVNKSGTVYTYWVL